MEMDALESARGLLRETAGAGVEDAAVGVGAEAGLGVGEQPEEDADVEAAGAGGTGGDEGAVSGLGVLSTTAPLHSSAA